MRLQSIAAKLDINKKRQEEVMLQSGRVVLSKMDEVQFGKPAAEAVAALVKSLDAQRVFLMVSGTLNRETDEI